MTSAIKSAMIPPAIGASERGRRRFPLRGLDNRFSRLERLTLALAMITIGVAGATAITTPAAARDFCISCSQPDAVYSCQVESGFTLPAEAAAKLHCIKELARRGAHRSCSVSRSNNDVPCQGEAVVLAPPSAAPAGPGNPPATIPAAIPPNALPSGRPSEVIGSQGEQDYRYAPAQPGPQTWPQPGDDARAERGEPPTGDNANEEHQRAPGQGPDVRPDRTVQPDQPVREEPTKRSNKPPKTVEELAKRAAEDSQKGLEKAGELVTDTAKSTGKTIENAGKAVGNAAKKTWDCVSSLFSKC